jgi:hypothetical protein
LAVKERARSLRERAARAKERQRLRHSSRPPPARASGTDAELIRQFAAHREPLFFSD